MRWAIYTFLFFGIVGIGNFLFDYTAHAVATITGDTSWDSPGFTQDRLLNGISVETTFKMNERSLPYGMSSLDFKPGFAPVDVMRSSTLHYRIDNPTDHEMTLDPAYFYCAPNGMNPLNDVVIESDQPIYIAANSIIEGSIPAISGGEYFSDSDLSEGRVSCALRVK